jgi:hypothetical protein
MLTLTLDGSRIHGITSLYDELNRVFMRGEDWTLGPSLDALDDLLHGGYGALNGHERARVVLTAHEHVREALGIDATREYLLGKLARPDLFTQPVFREKLARLEADGGPTYYQTVLEIFAEHPDIELVEA